MKFELHEIERKIVVLQNNVQVMLNELKKTIREVHFAEKLFNVCWLDCMLRREEIFREDTS